MSRLASRLQLAAIKPMSPIGHQPVPPARKSSMTTVVSPADPEYATAVAAMAGVPGSVIDRTPLQVPTTGDYSSIGWIAPGQALLIPTGVRHGSGD